MTVVTLVHAHCHPVPLVHTLGLAPSYPMPIDETKNKRLVIVVSQDTAKTIEQLAKKDRRPVSAYVRNVLEDHCQAAAMRAEAERLGGGVGIFPS